MKTENIREVLETAFKQAPGVDEHMYRRALEEADAQDMLVAALGKYLNPPSPQEHNLLPVREALRRVVGP